MSEAGQCTQSFTTDGPVMKLLYYEEKNVLITVTESLALTQHAVMPEGETKEMMKVRHMGHHTRSYGPPQEKTCLRVSYKARLKQSPQLHRLARIL